MAKNTIEIREQNEYKLENIITIVVKDRLRLIVKESTTESKPGLVLLCYKIVINSK